jgi:hypothetical protein
MQQKAKEADMSAATKTNREPAPEERAEKTTARDEIAVFFLRGLERSAEIQKQCIDLAVQQNNELFEVWKKAAEKTPGVPQLPMLDVSISAVNRYADIQKSAIDFVVEQSQIWTDALKERASYANKSAESIANVAKQTMESSFAVQKKALGHTAAQTRAVVDAARRQFGIKGPHIDSMTDTFQRGMDTVLEAQKELLDIVTH